MGKGTAPKSSKAMGNYLPAITSSHAERLESNSCGKVAFGKVLALFATIPRDAPRLIDYLGQASVFGG